MTIHTYHQLQPVAERTTKTALRFATLRAALWTSISQHAVVGLVGNWTDDVATKRGRNSELLHDASEPALNSSVSARYATRPSRFATIAFLVTVVPLTVLLLSRPFLR